MKACKVKWEELNGPTRSARNQKSTLTDRAGTEFIQPVSEVFNAMENDSHASQERERKNGKK